MQRWSKLILGAAAVALLASCGNEARPPVEKGWVAAATPEAVEAGIRVLSAGGNAIDAAVAVSFALGVTEPAMSGLGGQTQLLLFTPEGSARVLNGTSFAPAATPTDADDEEARGHRATTIPTTVRTLDHAFQHYGSGVLEWRQLLAPAIEYAEQGFEMGAFRHSVLERHEADLRASPSASALFLNGDGSAPVEGALFRQPVLAATLRRLAERGAADFYRGEIARSIASDMERHGGWLTYDDLAALPPLVELTALKGRYRDFDVWTLPPPGGGWVVLHVLDRLQQTDPHELQPGSPERALAIAEALKAGHRARRDHPIENLMDYEAEVKERLGEDSSRGETTHFSVVDAAGMAVSVTASLNNYYGAGVASPELGFLYNDYMREFRYREADHPFAIAPKAIPYSSMSPTILSRNGGAELVLGSPGSARSICAVAQVIQLWVDTPIGIERAVAFHRLHAPGDDGLYVEELPDQIEPHGRLEQAGFQIREPRTDLKNGGWNPYFGGVHAVAFENGHWQGAADPRRDGRASRATSPPPPR